MDQLKAKIGAGGRIVLPAEYRRALRLQVGDDVILRLEDGEVRISSARRAITRAQALVRLYIPRGSLTGR